MRWSFAGAAWVLMMGAGCGGSQFGGPGELRAMLSPYELDVTEVTVAAYRACVEAGGCSADGTEEIIYGGPSKLFCNSGRVAHSDYPMNCVSWYQADKYCKWAGKRLPTEQEWEYAASSGKDWTYPWGDSKLDKTKICLDSKGNGTCPVGSYPAGDNVFGVHDMIGSVVEWTSSSNYDVYDFTLGKGLLADARVVRGMALSGQVGEGLLAPLLTQVLARPLLTPVVGDASSHVRANPLYRGFELGFRCARSL